MKTVKRHLHIKGNVFSFPYKLCASVNEYESGENMFLVMDYCCKIDARLKLASNFISALQHCACIVSATFAAHVEYTGDFQKYYY